MKYKIHPTCHQITAACRCGCSLVIVSTLSEDISLDTCSSCHPQYTGIQQQAKAKKPQQFRKKYDTDFF